MTAFRAAMRRGGAGLLAGAVSPACEARVVGSMAATLRRSHNDLFKTPHPLASGGFDRELLKPGGRDRVTAIGAVLAALQRGPSARPGNQQV